MLVVRFLLDIVYFFHKIYIIYYSSDDELYLIGADNKTVEPNVALGSPKYEIKRLQLLVKQFIIPLPLYREIKLKENRYKARQYIVVPQYAMDLVKKGTTGELKKHKIIYLVI